MSLKNLLRRILPVSFNSFHARVDGLDDEVKELAETNASLVDSLATMEQYIRTLMAIETNRNGSAPPPYYMVCEAGYPNYGDELIAREWLRYLAKIHLETPVFLDCTRPGPAAAILSNEHPQLRVVDTLSRLTFENRYAVIEGQSGPVKDIAAYVNQALSDEGVAARYAAGIGIIKRTQSVHFVGGGYMNARWTSNLARLELGKWMKQQGKVSVATGTGLMPLNDEAIQFVQGQLPSFDRFTVRDEDTLRALTDENNHPESGAVELAPDDCFVNGLKHCYAKDQDLPRIMVCVQSDLVSDQAKLISHVIETIQAWKADDSEVVGVVECNPYIDYPIVEALRQEGCEVRFFPLAYLLKEGFPAVQGQQWLTTRYHPQILAAARGCKGSYISVDKQYYDSKHQAVLRMGSHWTRSEIGGGVVAPGTGFTDEGLPQKYEKQIRDSVAPLYGFAQQAA